MHLRHLATMVLPLEVFVSPVAAWSLLPRSNVLVTTQYSYFIELYNTITTPSYTKMESVPAFSNCYISECLAEWLSCRGNEMPAFNRVFYSPAASSPPFGTETHRDALGSNSTFEFWTSWLPEQFWFWSYEDSILIGPKPQQH